MGQSGQTHTPTEANLSCERGTNQHREASRTQSHSIPQLFAFTVGRAFRARTVLGAD